MAINMLNDYVLSEKPIFPIRRFIFDLIVVFKCLKYDRESINILFLND